MPVYETVEYNRAKKKKARFTHCFELVDLANSTDFFHQIFFPTTFQLYVTS